MKKNVTDILDIHTHKKEIDSQGKSIINYPLLTDSPLYMPLAKNAEVAVGRGLMLEEYLGFLDEGEGLVDTLSNNVFSARKDIIILLVFILGSWQNVMPINNWLFFRSS